MRKYTVLLILLLNLIITGCGGQSDKSINTESGKADVENYTKIWQDTHVNLNHTYDLSVVKENMIYSAYSTNSEVRLVYQNKEDGVILNEITLSDIDEVQNINADTNGNVYVTGNKGEQSSSWKVDALGNITSLGNVVLEDTDNMVLSAIPKGVFADSEERYYFWYRMCLPVTEIYSEEEIKKLAEEVDGIWGAKAYVDRIYVKNSQLDTIFYVQVADMRESRLINFYIDNNETPMLFAEDEGGFYVEKIDLEQRCKAEKTYSNTDIELSLNATSIASTEDGFLFCQNGYLFCFDYSSETYTKLLNLSSYGISSENILYLGEKNGIIEFVDVPEAGADAVYTTLVEGESQKEIITLGVLEPLPELEKIVSGYNRLQTDFRIQLVPYLSGETDYDEAANRLKMDIITGNAPDIIDVSGVDYSAMSDKGVLVDLYEYMTDEEELQSKDILTSVKNAYEIGGKLYSVAPAFQLYTMWGKPEVIQNQSGVTLAQLHTILNYAGKDINAISGFSADESVLTTLCAFGMDEFIDWDEHICNFDGDYFKEILEFAKSYEGPSVEGLIEGIAENDIVMSVGLISSVADYQMQNKIYAEEIDFIGYPTSKGSGTAIGFTGAQLAINAQSEHKSEAWKFVQYYILNGYADWGFPVLEAKFQECLQEAQQEEFVTEDGYTYQMAKASYFDGKNSIEVFAANSEEVEQISALVESATNSFKYNTEILNIILEEAEAYLNDQKSIEKVTNIIQNRVQLYLDE